MTISYDTCHEPYLNSSERLINDLQSGPCDPAKHSKLPFFMRLHGSILPKMIIPLLVVGGWASAITCISKFVYNRMCY